MDPLNIPSRVSYQLDWVNADKPFALTDVQHQFTGHFFPTQAHMAWTAERADGFRFVSDAAETSTAVFAETGTVRNGLYFRSASED